MTERIWLGCLCLLIVIPLHAENAIQLLSHEGKAVSGVVLYLQHKAPEGESAQASIRPTISQRNKQFQPYVSVVQVGVPVSFENNDDIAHHIYSLTGKERFSFKIRKDEAARTLQFQQAGIIPMGCNIHDWMSGYLLVVDTPYYGITDDNGRVLFSHIESGSYTLRVWHPQMKEADRDQQHIVAWPLTDPFSISLTQPLDSIPEQKPLDDFDFLDGY
ncbi:hypothetical protein [Pleionea sp. CnH1-48]|uniref:hypothetical protein n=1 Tax=Pleionea sp. CnH1-48 TaxID=2954494 RepID=UPI0020969F1D|nr:hypothetical protein [Pleionea sp. CnH1-48]MCO7226466.1 hypothetical protein [Pleionea sp. CnH1-48]